MALCIFHLLIKIFILEILKQSRVILNLTLRHPELVSGSNWHTFEINNIRRKFFFSQNGNQYFVHSPQLGQIVLLSVDKFPNPLEEP